ncbi:hypothetical protein A8U91_04726 [Halomonas elongata]|uniref:Uncharacterized protein n=1 Tax=Halomonas elongata TaxID=2746 RepID=A0A1B8P076_HALEL|nr:hypothetical protein [Halomonas elongata]OBX35652.1 hypothetical protein A8U91_04726 [Halomonas elongata]
MSERAELLLKELLAEQRETNQLLGMLIEALADEGDGGDEDESSTYLDGTPAE